MEQNKYSRNRFQIPYTLWYNGKRVIFSINGAESIAFKGKNKITLTLTSNHTKKQSQIYNKCINRSTINVKVTTDENIGEHLYKLEVNKYLLNRTQNVLITKEKLKVIYNKIDVGSFSSSKYTIKSNSFRIG